MKTIYLFLCLAFTFNCYSQDDTNKTTTPQPVSDEVLTDLVYNCTTVFWTVNSSNQIKQWDLIDNVVSGGNVVVSFGDNSIAFAGSPDLTFYCGRSTSIRKYNFATSSWDTIPTNVAAGNMGGYHGDIYSMYGLSMLYYFDGTTLSLIPDSTPASSNSYGVADIAVDSNGKAWVFEENFSGYIYSLKKFDRNGLLVTYSVNPPIIANGCYGSFFINDNLYVGRGDGVIIPININGSIASAGTNIPFPYANYLDMASCNTIAPLGIPENELNNQFTIYPNPTQDVLNISSNENIPTLLVYSIDGKLLKTVHNSKSIDISDLASSTYLLKIISENNVYNKFIIKK